MIIYDVRDAETWPHSAAFVEAFGDWLTSHDIEKNVTWRVECRDGEPPFARVFQLALNADGNVYLDEATAEPAERQPFDVPITTPAPNPADFEQAADHG